MTVSAATLTEAAAAHRRGDYANAAALYQRALAAQPDSADLLGQLAAAKLGLRAWGEAEELYRRALALAEPADAEWRGGLGQALREQGRMAEAIEALRQACDDDPFLPEPLIALGQALSSDGQGEAAEDCYRAALEIDPHVGAAHLGLGIVLAKRGAAEPALASLLRATQLLPGSALAWREYAAVLGDRRRFEESAAAFDRALTLAPNDAVAAYHAGHMHMRWHKAARAVHYYEIAYNVAPDSLELRCGLAGGLQEAGDVDRALALIDTVLAEKPDMADAHNVRGNCLFVRRAYANAVDAYRETLRFNPTLGIAAYNLGNALRYLGRLTEAMAAFEQALEIDPEVASAYNGIGIIEQQRGHHAAALQAFERALEIEPTLGDALNNMAVSLQNLGRFSEALAAYYELIDLQPERSAVYFNLGTMLQMLERWDESIVILRKGLLHDPDGAIFYPYLLHAMQQQCNWHNLDAIIEKVRANTEAEIASGHSISITPFALQSLPAEFSMALRQQVAARTAVRAEAARSDGRPAYTFKPAQAPAAQPAGTDGARRRLRVGYVSPDFRFHSVAVSFKGILDAHDRDGFEFHAYSLNTVREDDLTRYFRQGFDQFHDIARLTYREAADLIHANEVDILVDLAGHTRGTRHEIFALRPAPVTVHYLGYSATTGASYIDYLITDHRQVPAEQRQYFSENLVYLPDVFMAGRRAEIAATAPSRTDEGLPEDAVVLANFNNHYKFEPRMFSVWMRLLKRIPRAVLWVMASSDLTKGHLQREAAARGVDPGRIVFARKLRHPEHLARLPLADFCVDNLYHGGGITTIDALWAGVPVLTVAGETPQSRNGASLVTAVGMPKLVCDSLEQFDALAHRLATHPADLAALRAELAAKRDTQPLFDMPRLARHLETAYRMMWQRHCDGLPPAMLDVPAIDGNRT